MPPRPHLIQRQLVTSPEGLQTPFPGLRAEASFVLVSTGAEALAAVDNWTPWCRRWMTHPAVDVWHLAIGHALPASWQQGLHGLSTWSLAKDPFPEGGPGTPDLWVIDQALRVRWHGSGAPTPRRQRALAHALGTMGIS